MICEKCHMENADGVKFCKGCGNPLNAGASAMDSFNHQNNYQPQNYQQNPPYTQGYANYNQNNIPKKEEHMSVGGWIGVFCINLIPCVGSLIYLIMLFVWAFGGTPKKSLKTYAKAQLLIMLISVVLVVIVWLIMLSLGVSIASMDDLRF